MNLGDWGFRHWPFDRTYAEDQFFASPLHEEAIARLFFLVEESRRCGIVTGPSGTGKTYLLRLAQKRAERLGRLTVRCDAMGLDGPELIGQIAVACHVACDPDTSPAKIWNGLQTRLIGLALIQQPLVVIVDHFDSIGIGCHEAILRLIRLTDAVGVKLTILMATRERAIPVLLHDVVELRIEVVPWTAEETSQFIITAIQHAGCLRNIFSEDAIASLHEATAGIPSRVVSTCHLSLLAAMGQDLTMVTREIVDASATELLPPILDYRQTQRLPSAAPARGRLTDDIAAIRQ